MRPSLRWSHLPLPLLVYGVPVGCARCPRRSSCATTSSRSPPETVFPPTPVSSMRHRWRRTRPFSPASRSPPKRSSPRRMRRTHPPRWAIVVATSSPARLSSAGAWPGSRLPARRRRWGRSQARSDNPPRHRSSARCGWWRARSEPSPAPSASRSVCWSPSAAEARSTGCLPGSPRCRGHTRRARHSGHCGAGAGRPPHGNTRGDRTPTPGDRGPRGRLRALH